jgi:hypothetical protein
MITHSAQLLTRKLADVFVMAGFLTYPINRRLPIRV